MVSDGLVPRMVASLCAPDQNPSLKFLIFCMDFVVYIKARLLIETYLVWLLGFVAFDLAEC